MYEQGNREQQKSIKTALEKLSQDDLVTISENGQNKVINLKDKEAEKLLHKLLGVQLKPMESRGLQMEFDNEKEYKLH